MIEVSAEAWHAIHYLVTPWQYLPRLGILFYILSHLGSICRGLACYSISCRALAVSAEAWHAILYLITPWQYLPRLGILFYILSRLGSICLGLAFYSISYHALAVSAKAWHAFRSYHALAVSAEAWHSILYLVTPWQNPQKDQPPKTQATKAQAET